MRTVLKLGTVVAALCVGLTAAQRTAEAGKAEGVGIGAGLGAVVAGPLGAVVGGVVGYKVGGPNIISKPRYTCWRNESGQRKCRRR